VAGEIDEHVDRRRVDRCGRRVVAKLGDALPRRKTRPDSPGQLVFLQLRRKGNQLDTSSVELRKEVFDRVADGVRTQIAG
jgi:hypothetical protein